MTPYQQMLKTFNVSSDMSVNKAIYCVRETLEGHHDPLFAANDVLRKIGIKPLTNTKMAFIFVMTAVEQTMKNITPNIEDIVKLSNKRTKAITDMLGPGSFNIDHSVIEPKKGSKRQIAKNLYLAHCEKGDKYVIELVQKELNISKQNAYTYVYLVKKELDKQ